ncbi:imidazole glycerol phosphate synthase subunit HisH [Rubinisphaera sp. JC750]|uniref:imidazole glycerol phosphate synthase subunit HisH n=1 Tax=Rubinisphaera sp. JC750 TaxID=2898658 RepID=UPI001F017ABC|nr:imidazole glycerol phosphate synthase subunit HisH [Rubinisphaera sp. JC750]
MIHIIDYGMGNLRSVAKGFEKVEAEARICSDPAELASAEKIVLPGVGAFRDAIAHLNDQGFTQPLLDYIASGRPFLGICLGLQLLFDKSYEDGEYDGLGVIPGNVVKFKESPGLKIPHMGWNQLSNRRDDNPLFVGIPDDAWFYFVHSYHVVPTEEAVVAARTGHGDDVVAAIRRDNMFAVQFHPEKSQQNGLQILKNFANL